MMGLSYLFVCLPAARTLLLMVYPGEEGSFVLDSEAGAGLVPPLPHLRVAKAVEGEAGT